MLRAWTVERWLMVMTFVLSALGFTFGLGVNWAHITEQDANLKAFERTYVRSDVYAADQRRLSESVDRLTRAIETMQVQQAPRVPSFTSRMFDK